MNLTLAIILLVVVAIAAAGVTVMVINSARKKQADKIIKEAEQEGENIKKRRFSRQRKNSFSSKANMSVISTRKIHRSSRLKTRSSRKRCR